VARGRTWFRVERDWFSDGAILELVDRAGTVAIVAWFRLLGRACLSEGEFKGELHAELADLNLGIDRKAAKSIADAMIDLGLVCPDEQGYVIRSWSAYQPPMRYTTPAARITQGVTSDNRGVTTNVRTNEQTNVRTNGIASVRTILEGRA